MYDDDQWHADDADRMTKRDLRADRTEDEPTGNTVNALAAIFRKPKDTPPCG